MSRKFLFITLALAVILHMITADSKCQKDRAQALQEKKSGKKGVFVTHCKKNGDYRRAQCDFSKGVCFCLDPKTGEKTSGDQKGEVECDSS